MQWLSEREALFLKEIAKKGRVRLADLQYLGSSSTIYTTIKLLEARKLVKKGVDDSGFRVAELTEKGKKVAELIEEIEKELDGDEN